MTDIIFDFDGTLVDSFEIIAQIIYSLLTPKRAITKEDIYRFKDVPLRRLMTELNIGKFEAPLLLMRGRKIMTHRVGELDFASGILDTIWELSKEHRLYIISTNSTSNIVAFLNQNHAGKYFKLVKGGIGYFDKAKAINKFIARQKIDKNRCVYIGDEVRDIEAAHMAGIKSIAVGWGVASEDSLKAILPLAFVKEPQDILHLIRKLDKQ